MAHKSNTASRKSMRPATVVKSSTGAATTTAQRGDTISHEDRILTTARDHGALSSVLGASIVAVQSLDEIDVHLAAWQDTALAVFGGVSARKFGEMTDSNPNELGRLVRAATLRQAYAKVGLIVSPSRIKSKADRMTKADMTAALATLKSRTSALADGPVALTAERKAADNQRKSRKGTRKPGSSRNGTVTTVKPEDLKPSQYGKALEYMTARVADIPAKERAALVEAARLFADTLEALEA